MGLSFFKRRARPEEKKAANQARITTTTTTTTTTPSPPLVQGKSSSRPVPLPVCPATAAAAAQPRLNWVPTPHAASETNRLVLGGGIDSSSSSRSTSAAAASAEADLSRLIARAGRLARAAPDLNLGGLGPTARWLRGDGGAVDELLAQQMRAQRRLRDRAQALGRCAGGASCSSSSAAGGASSVVVVTMDDVSRAVLPEASLRAGTRAFVLAESAAAAGLGAGGRTRDFHRFRHMDGEEEVNQDMALAAGHLARLSRLPAPRGSDVEVGREAKVSCEGDALWSDPGALARLEGSHVDDEEEEEEEEEEVYDPELRVVNDVVVVISGGARLVDVLPPSSPRDAERSECSAPLSSPSPPAMPCPAFFF